MRMLGEEVFGLADLLFAGKILASCLSSGKPLVCGTKLLVYKILASCLLSGKHLVCQTCHERNCMCRSMCRAARGSVAPLTDKMLVAGLRLCGMSRRYRSRCRGGTGADVEEVEALVTSGALLRSRH